MLSFKNIIEAHELIKPFIHQTPVLCSRSLNEIVGCELFFKCENFQKVGAFKYRGATNAVQSLNYEEAIKGVATHSSGNHAQALALAAKIRGIKATIVMPNNAPFVKKTAVAGYGAEIVECEPTLKAREDTLDMVIKQNGSTFIHPYDNDKVIAGQGTAAKELIESVDGLEIIIAPVGGGGLLSGTAISTKELLKECKVIAAEPIGADDAFRSFKSGVLIPQISPKTICDGLLTSLSERTFSIIQNKVDDIFTVSDSSVKQAMKLIFERMKIIIEPSSAVTLAAILSNKEYFHGKKIGLIISGGNIDFANFDWS